MSQRLSKIMAASSLLLCMAIAALWVRSYFAADQLVVGSDWHLFGMASSRGRFVSGTVTLLKAGAISERGFETRRPEDLDIHAWRHWGGLGFYFVSDSDPFAAERRLLVLPFWFLQLCFTIHPALLFLRWRRRRRENQDRGFPVSPTT